MTIEKLYEETAEATQITEPYAFVLSELSEIFGIDGGTLRDRIPWSSRRGRARRYLREDIEHYLVKLNPDQDFTRWYGHEWLDTDQAAKHLKTTAENLRKLRERGGGPPYLRLAAGTVRYSVAALTELAWRDSATGSELLMLS